MAGDSGTGGDTGGDTGGSASGCLPIYSVCDEFEAPAIDTAKWIADAMISIDTTRSHRGANLGIGFSGSNVVAAQPAIDLWIDDVIIHTAPITCAD